MAVLVLFSTDKTTTLFYPDLLKELNISTILLVTDAQLRKAGITASLEHILKAKEKCQVLITFGGGSSMDCAKAVGARIAYPNKSLNQMKSLLKAVKKIPALIAIPTTADTGSEVTITAVITDSDKKYKYTKNSFTLIPRYAVLNPEVTYSLPHH